MKTTLVTAAAMGSILTFHSHPQDLGPIVLGGYGKPPKTKPNPNPNKKQKKRKAAHKARIMSRKVGR
jgi:hypothetical protein